LALLSALILPLGCASTTAPFLNTGHPVELNRVEQEDGRLEVYKLDLASNKRDLTLTVRTERVEERPDLGLTLREIDKNLARRKSLDPYKGLYVDRVKSDGQAERAGVLTGDILMEVAGVELRYVDQYEHVLKTKVKLGGEAEIVVRRGHENQQELRLKLVPGAKKVRIPSTEAIPLQTPRAGGPEYSGMIYGTLPAEWTERIYDDHRPTLIVGNVYVGSPAYLAGIRPGDRLVSVNGRYFENADRLKQQLQEWGARGENAQIEVFQHRGGRYYTEVDLAQFSSSTNIKIPLVFVSNNSADRTEWDLLPGGLLMGYSGEYRRSSTRDTNYWRVFSTAVGLYRREWSPNGSRTRLLWFIRWGSH